MRKKTAGNITLCQFNAAQRPQFVSKTKIRANPDMADCTNAMALPSPPKRPPPE